eukprot:TRINITY_DN10694_c0_g1_i1.p1 TRINITY_DN10694_c0_g1~~TRINITY_DN10694_c0_g1_i1.p1  ORF type:complete len:291 (+),score=23.70 TRINITY_DN10694_c0_g1_i1:205-1077(+)
MYGGGASIVPVAGDGNCQFRALSASMTGSETHHSDLRRAAVQQIRRNPEKYQDFIPGGRRGMQQYLRELERNGHWGDEVSLKAASDATGVPVTVHNRSVSARPLRYGENNRAGVSVAYSGRSDSGHYDSVQPNPSLNYGAGSGIYGGGAGYGGYGNMYSSSSAYGNGYGAHRGVGPAGGYGAAAGYGTAAGYGGAAYGGATAYNAQPYLAARGYIPASAGYTSASAGYGLPVQQTLGGYGGAADRSNGGWSTVGYSSGGYAGGYNAQYTGTYAPPVSGYSRSRSMYASYR